MGRFFILCVGVVMDTQMGVRPAGKRQTGVCRSPEVITKGDLPRGMKRSGINRLRCYPTSPPCGFVGQAKFWPDFRFFYFVKNFRFRPNLSVLADIFTYTGHNFGHRKYVYMRNPFTCFTL